ncbi:hypothetical protein HUT18_12100 [Streptomyces sp. NA04227]|uniref:SCO6745 family protein n=1 Tax=Streptomyces sp. NA04227 TaxID=2742136 RepID=UPI001590C53C|nr:hypothetical protein [Streptomyces sp. NA04227]QKW10806.1 hypothetical protein HUT18_12100 [Streptomyces sp. NA04227]
MWHLFEPVHALVYYAPEVDEEMAALGYPGGDRWPRYFPLRAAPLGAVGATSVASAFYSLEPGMVAQNMAAAWDRVSPTEVIAARLRGMERTYRRLFGERHESPELTQAARLLGLAAEAAPLAGRPLAAANAALGLPEEPLPRLWQAATVLREHRGDGHLAALLTAGLDPVESLVSFAAVGAASREVFNSRGWSDREWGAARDRLHERGLVAADGTATAEGRALRARIEEQTDVLALAPWQALGAERMTQLADLLGEFWVAAIGSGLLPAENTLGIGKV